MSAAEAREREAEAVVENILKLASTGHHRRRGKEPVFLVETPKPKRRWRRNRQPVAAVMTGWRIGCYYRTTSGTLSSGYRVRREFSHPVYLLSDGRLVVAAFRVVDAEGSVKLLELPRSRRPAWFRPLEDNRDFFAARPAHYLDELRALRADLQ